MASCRLYLQHFGQLFEIGETELVNREGRNWFGKRPSPQRAESQRGAGRRAGLARHESRPSGIRVEPDSEGEPPWRGSRWTRWISTTSQSCRSSRGSRPMRSVHSSPGSTPGQTHLPRERPSCTGASRSRSLGSSWTAQSRSSRRTSGAAGRCSPAWDPVASLRRPTPACPASPSWSTSSPQSPRGCCSSTSPASWAEAPACRLRPRRPTSTEP